MECIHILESATLCITRLIQSPSRPTSLPSSLPSSNHPSTQASASPPKPLHARPPTPMHPAVHPLTHDYSTQDQREALKKDVAGALFRRRNAVYDDTLGYYFPRCFFPSSTKREQKESYDRCKAVHRAMRHDFSSMSFPPERTQSSGPDLSLAELTPGYQFPGSSHLEIAAPNISSAEEAPKDKAPASPTVTAAACGLRDMPPPESPQPPLEPSVIPAAAVPTQEVNRRKSSHSHAVGQTGAKPATRKESLARMKVIKLAKGCEGF